MCRRIYLRHWLFDQQPTNTASSSAIDPAVTVRVEDAYGNLTTSSATIYISIGNDPSTDATLSGDIDVDAVNGVATFSDLSIDNSGNGYTLVASDAATADGATGLTDATSDAFNIGSGSVDNFLVEAAGGGAIGEQTAGESFDIQITARDASNNTVTGFNGTVDLSLNNDGEFTTGGGTTATFSSGVLSNHTVKIDSAANGYEITATNGSETGTSNSFNVVPNTIAALQFTQQPTNSEAGATITPAVTVQVFDDFGNEVSQESEGITLTISEELPSTIAPQQPMLTDLQRFLTSQFLKQEPVIH